MPDVAASTLLSLDMALLARVRSETRRRLLARIPNAGWSTRWKLFAARILAGCMAAAERMDECEMVEFEAKLRALEDQPESQHWRFLGFGALYAAGRASLRSEAEELLVAHSEAAEASFMFSLILRTPPAAEMTAVALRILDSAVARKLNAVELLRGIRRVGAEGSEEQREVSEKL